METYAIRLAPRGDLVERHLRRAEAERYVETFNRVMVQSDLRAEPVREPVETDATMNESLPNRWGVA